MPVAGLKNGLRFVPISSAWPALEAPREHKRTERNTMEHNYLNDSKSFCIPQSCPAISLLCVSVLHYLRFAHFVQEFLCKRKNTPGGPSYSSSSSSSLFLIWLRRQPRCASVVYPPFFRSLSSVLRPSVSALPSRGSAQAEVRPIQISVFPFYPPKST